MVLPDAQCPSETLAAERPFSSNEGDGGLKTRRYHPGFRRTEIIGGEKKQRNPDAR